MKKKLLFIGHVYHKTTGSSSFIINLLEDLYDVIAIKIDPTIVVKAEDVLPGNLHEFDLVVLWQIDYLARYFLDRELPTVVMPMYDASSHFAPIHWQSASRCLFVSFSLELHWKICSAGCDSLFLKYFPERRKLDQGCQVTSSKTSDEAVTLYPSQKGLSAFFWERRPDTMINLNTVCSMMKGNISHLHVHQAPDPGFKSTPIPSGLAFDVTRSEWFDNSDDLYREILGHDIYVAPRYAEGIGMGYLEAMSEGRVVIAHDSSTHNEYIRNWDNGILVDFTKPIDLAITQDQVDKIKIIASGDSDRWRKNWSHFYIKLLVEKIADYVEHFESRAAADINKKGFYVGFDALANAHTNQANYYLNLQQLSDISKSSMNSNSREYYKYYKPIIHEINSLIKNGNYNTAISMIKNRIEYYGEDSPYYKLLQQIQVGSYK